MIERVAPGTGSIVSVAGPAIMIGSIKSSEEAVLTSPIDAVSTVAVIGIGVGVGVAVGVDVGVAVGVAVGVGEGGTVGVGVGLGGGTPATMTPR